MVVCTLPRSANQYNDYLVWEHVNVLNLTKYDSTIECFSLVCVDFWDIWTVKHRNNVKNKDYHTTCISNNTDTQSRICFFKVIGHNWTCRCDPTYELLTNLDQSNKKTY